MTKLAPRFKIGQIICVGDMEVIILAIIPDNNQDLHYCYKFLIHPEHPEFVGCTKDRPYEMIDLVAELKPLPFNLYWREINA